jgi:hypothetical protein
MSISGEHGARVRNFDLAVADRWWDLSRTFDLFVDRLAVPVERNHWANRRPMRRLPRGVAEHKRR